MTWQGFYINLDRSEERRADIEAQLLRLGMAEQYQRFPAVNGRELRPEQAAFSAAELGCYVSHMEVISRNSGLGKWLHVLEDDVVISRHTQSALSMLTSHPDCGRYDMIFTNVTLHGPSYLMAQFCRLFDDNVQLGQSGEVEAARITVAPLAGREFVSATSYLINPSSIGKVAGLLRTRLNAEPFAPVDLVFSSLSRSGALQVGCTVPFFTLPRWDVPSTIRDWSLVQSDVPLLIAVAAMFADRDVSALKAQLDTLRQSISLSPTSALVADAYALVLGGWLIDRTPPAGGSV